MCVIVFKCKEADRRERQKVTWLNTKIQETIDDFYRHIGTNVQHVVTEGFRRLT